MVGFRSGAVYNVAVILRKTSRNRLRNFPKTESLKDSSEKINREINKESQRCQGLFLKKEGKNCDVGLLRMTGAWQLSF
jgi:hypothetical protein